MQSVPSLLPVIPPVAVGMPDIDPSEEGAFLASVTGLGPVVPPGREEMAEMVLGGGQGPIHWAMPLPVEQEVRRQLTASDSDAAVLEGKVSNDLPGGGDPTASEAIGRLEAPERKPIAENQMQRPVASSSSCATSMDDPSLVDVDGIVTSPATAEVLSEPQEIWPSAGANLAAQIAGDWRVWAGAGMVGSEPVAPHETLVPGSAVRGKADRMSRPEASPSQFGTGSVGSLPAGALRVGKDGLRGLSLGADPSAFKPSIENGWPTPQALPHRASVAPRFFATHPHWTLPEQLQMATGQMGADLSTALVDASSTGVDGEMASPDLDRTSLPRTPVAQPNSELRERLSYAMSAPQNAANALSGDDGRMPSGAADASGQMPFEEGVPRLPTPLVVPAAATVRSAGQDNGAAQNLAAYAAGPAKISEATPDEELPEITALAVPLTNALSTPVTGQTAIGPQTPPVTQVAAQLAAALQATADGGAELALSPEELGRVRLRLEPDRLYPDRVIVLMTFERPETLDLFRRHAVDLSEALRAAGYAGADLGFDQEGGGAYGDRHHAGTSDHAEPLAEVDAPSYDPRPASGASLDLRL